MHIPDPPTPDQLASAGIQLDGPPPPDMSHLSDEELEKIAGGSSDMSHLSDEELMKIAGKDKGSGGLDAERPVQHVPYADQFGAVLHGINQANPFIIAPKAGAYLMNKALTATGVQSQDNPDVSNTLNDIFSPNPKATGINKALEAGGNMAMAVPETGAAVAASPILGTAAAAKYIPWAAEGAGFLGKTGQYISNAGRVVPRIGQAILKGATAPTSSAAAYTAANMGAGVGQDVAHQMTKDASPFVSVPAELAGSLAGAGVAGYSKYLSPVTWGGRFSKRVYNDLTGADDAAIKNLSADTVLDKFKPHSSLVNQFEGLKTPEAQQGLAEAARLREKIPGFQPTLGEATDLASAKVQQNNIESKSSGNILDSFARRKQAQEQALTNFAQNAGPGLATRGDTAAIDRAAKTRIEGVQQPINDQMASIQMKREEVADTLPSAKSYDVGSFLRNRLEGLKTEKSNEMSQLAQNMGLVDAQKLPVNTGSLHKAVIAALPSGAADTTRNLALKASPTMRAIAKLDEGEKLSFVDAKFFMEQMGQESRNAAKLGDMKSAKMITDARNNIDDYLKTEWSPGVGLGDKYARFRQTYKNEYIDRFGAGDAKDVTAVGADQRPRTDNEDVVSRFWNPGDITSAKNFHRTFGDDPQALDALNAHVMDEVRNATVKDGVVDQKVLTKYLAQNKDNLREFPSIEAKLKNAQSLNQSLTDRAATLNMRQETIEDTQLAKALGTGKTYEALMQDPALLKRTAASMSDGEKAAMSRRMWSDATLKIDSPDQLGTFLKSNGEQLGAVMSPEHVENLQDLHKALVMNARTTAPRGSANVISPIEAFVGASGVSPQNIMSRGYAMARHVVSPEYIMADILTKMGIATSKVQSKKMIGRAIYDPEFANKLSNFMTNPSNTKAQGFKSYMLNAGIQSVADQSDDSN